jgi:hypothetical protein
MKDWEVRLNFRIHGKHLERELIGTTTEILKDNHNEYDGLALWYTKTTIQRGPLFGSNDLFNGLGVVVEVYSRNNQSLFNTHIYPLVYKL